MYSVPGMQRILSGKSDIQEATRSYTVCTRHANLSLSPQFPP